MLFVEVQLRCKVPMLAECQSRLESWAVSDYSQIAVTGTTHGNSRARSAPGNLPETALMFFQLHLRSTHTAPFSHALPRHALPTRFIVGNRDLGEE